MAGQPGFFDLDERYGRCRRRAAATAPVRSLELGAALERSDL
jgi:hypothetical protein